MRIYYTAIVIVMLLLASCAQQETSDRAINDEAEVRQAMSRLVSTYNAGDLDGHLALFADDSIELPPGQAVVVGVEAIHKRKAAGMKRADAVLEAKIEEIIVSGDWAVVRINGTGTISIKNGPTLYDDSKALLVWHRIDGDWKLTHDIWNSNTPAK